MRRIDSRIKIGTKCQITAFPAVWFEVNEIEAGKWVKFKDLCGSFQNGHILKFTNKVSK